MGGRLVGVQICGGHVMEGIITVNRGGCMIISSGTKGLWGVVSIS